MKFTFVSKLYYALCLALFPGILISFTFPPGLRLYLYDIIVLLIAFVSVMLSLEYRKLIWKNGRYIILFGVTGLIGLIISFSSLENFLHAFGYLVRLFLYLSIVLPLFILPQNKIIKILILITLSGFLFLGFGYLQYILYPDLANLFYLGWDRHLYRFFSTLLDPNFTGIFLTILLLITFSGATFIKNKNYKKVVLLSSLLFLPAVFLTYSRSAYIMLFVSALTFLYFYSKKLALLFTIVFLLAIIFIPKNFGGEGVNLLRTASITARFQAITGATSIFLKHPVVGVGFNNIRQFYLQEHIITSENISSHAANGTPNSYIFTLATTGVIGMGFLLLFIFFVLKQVLYIKKDTGNLYILSRAFFAAFIGVLTVSLFENALFYGPILILLLLFGGIVFRLNQLEKN